MYEVIIDVLAQDRSQHIHRKTAIAADAMEIQDVLYEAGVEIETILQLTDEEVNDEPDDET